MADYGGSNDMLTLRLDPKESCCFRCQRPLVAIGGVEVSSDGIIVETQINRSNSVGAIHHAENSTCPAEGSEPATGNNTDGIDLTQSKTQNSTENL